MQRYNRFRKPDSKTSIPVTRILSYQEFCKDRNTTIKGYLLELLPTTEVGMTCREISNHSGIWVQSLTYPLKSLLIEGKLKVIGFKVSSVSNRLVQVYGVSESFRASEDAKK